MEDLHRHQVSDATPYLLDVKLKYQVRQGQTSQTAISIPSDEDIEDEDEDEDDFEEVAIPDQAGPSSAPTTPAGHLVSAVNTPGTNTTAPSIDDDFEGFGEDDDEEGEKQDEVIRLEIGGENEEEKAKRIALAMRK
jgi:hypothetical protein